MSVFESLTRFWQGSAVVIALTFLVVGHLPALNVGGVYIPAQGVIRADDDEYENPNPPPIPPPPIYVYFPPPPYERAPEGVDPDLPIPTPELDNYVEMGECDQNWLDAFPT